MATPRMLMLVVTFCYTGLMLTFWSGVYGTSIGRTKSFGDDAKSLVGLHGIVIGAGEIVGGMYLKCHKVTEGDIKRVKVTSSVTN